MDNLLHLAIVGIAFLVFTLLFYHASGSLSLKSLNMNSIMYYFLLVWCFVGASAIFCGFRDHYVLGKCREEILMEGYFLIMYALISLPIYLIFFQRLIGIHSYKRFMDKFINKEFILEREQGIFKATCFFTVLGFLALGYTFYILGYIPILELFRGNIGILLERVAITRDFGGNQYIRNILALSMIPMLSYLAYIYYRVTNKKRWKRLFCVLFLGAVLCKTYNFAKGPVIFYVFYFYLLDVLLGRIKNHKNIIYIGVVASIFIVFVYVYLLDFDGELISLSMGPMGRIFISQIATSFLHFQVFPDVFSYLNGSSFPQSFSFLLDAFLENGEYGIRSGRLVMEAFNPIGIILNVAGVMNSLFVAEAYANFGYVGVLLSPVVVAVAMTIIPNMIISGSKTPINLLLYVLCTIEWTQCITGGFIDFIYNVNLIIQFFIIYLIHFMSKFMCAK